MLSEEKIRERLATHQAKRDEALAKLEGGDLSEANQVVWSNACIATCKDVLGDLEKEHEADPYGYSHRPQGPCEICAKFNDFETAPREEIANSLVCMHCGRVMRRRQEVAAYV